MISIYTLAHSTNQTRPNIDRYILLRPRYVIQLRNMHKPPNISTIVETKHVKWIAESSTAILIMKERVFF